MLHLVFGLFVGPGVGEAESEGGDLDLVAGAFDVADGGGAVTSRKNRIFVN